MANEDFELNEVDAARPIGQILKLRDIAVELGFQEDAAHWHKVLKLRKESDSEK